MRALLFELLGDKRLLTFLEYSIYIHNINSDGDKKAELKRFIEALRAQACEQNFLSDILRATDNMPISMQGIC